MSSRTSPSSEADRQAGRRPEAAGRREGRGQAAKALEKGDLPKAIENQQKALDATEARPRRWHDADGRHADGR